MGTAVSIEIVDELPPAAVAALAMGWSGLAWLGRLTARGYESAAVTDDGRAVRSGELRLAVPSAT